MRIRRSIERSGTLLPRALNVLEGLPPECLFHTEQGKRHPKSGYGKSLRLIGEQWIRVYHELDVVHKDFYWEKKDIHYPDLLREYTELLHRLHQHNDACLAALRSLCPLTSAKKPIKLDSQYLTAVKLPGWRSFCEGTKEYQQKRIGAAVNALKHDGAELCMFYMYSDMEFRPGYFLQDVLQNGSLGPSEKLHTDGRTAFSFARDMLIHLWWIYRTGELLADTIACVCDAWHGQKISERALPGDFGSDWTEILRRCSTLKPEFFPDEINQPYPQVVLRESDQTVTLTFPTTARGHRILGEVRFTTGLTVDAEHLNNRIPYFGKPAEKYFR